jgi:ornithine--oxo-acid transaminase
MNATAAQSQVFIDLEEQYGAHNYHPLDVVIERGEGVWVYDVDGRKYLDCLAAYSAVNQGHCHPRIMRAVVDQVKRVTLTSRAFRNDQLPRLCKLLHDLTGYGMSLPMNSGAEAVETAVKAARKWGYTVKGIPKDRAEIIVCADNFHGRTTTIVSFSTDGQYRDGFGPFTPGFRVIPFGERVIPPDGYLKQAEALCRANNVLFICDEIQAGLGRTGKLFAHQWEGVRPDMVIIAKALSGGYYPISAVLADKGILGVFKPGDHGSTFGGNPLACAVAREALQVLVDEKLVERSAELGQYFLAKLKALRSSVIKEIRGRGLWIGVELTVPARPYCERLMQEGMLCKETHDRVIRLAPPLVITREEIDWAVEKLKKVI